MLLRRDRALLELLYAAGLRVSELTGLNLVDMEQKERILRVRGKGNKERIVPYGAKAQEALEKYWPVREQLLLQTNVGAEADAGPHMEAVFLNYSGRRLTQRSVGRIVKKVRAHRECKLGPASAFVAACVCDASAGRWRGPARDSGTSRAPIALNHAEVHARVDTPADGDLRQGAPARLTGRARLVLLGTFTDRFEGLAAYLAW